MNHAQRWKCVSIGDGSWGVTLGLIYKCDEDGQIIKDRGIMGTYPWAYNMAGTGSPKFVRYEQPKNMVNK